MILPSARNAGSSDAPRITPREQSMATIQRHRVGEVDISVIGDFLEHLNEYRDLNANYDHTWIELARCYFMWYDDDFEGQPTFSATLEYVKAYGNHMIWRIGEAIEYINTHRGQPRYRMVAADANMVCGSLKQRIAIYQNWMECVREVETALAAREQ